MLEQLPTSSDLGAPAQVAHAQGGVVRRSDDRSSASAALSAVVTAAGEGGGGGLPTLGLALLGITLALLGSARRHIR